VSVLESTSAGDRPLPDVVVTMHRRGAREIARSTSDASGRAEFAGLAAGAWLAQASFPGHESATAPCAVADGVLANPVEIVLKKRAIVRGTVRDAAGAATAQALVQLHPSSKEIMRRMMEGTEPPRGSRKAEAATDDYGRFVMTDVPVGADYVIWVCRPTVGVRAFEVPALQPGEDRTVDVALERVATIHGEIPPDVLGDGRAAVDLLIRDGRGVDQEKRVTVGPGNGEYLFDLVRSGEKLMAFTVRQGTRFYAGFQDARVSEGEHVEMGAWRPLGSMVKLRLKPVIAGLEARDADLMIDASEGEPRRYVRLMHVFVPIGTDFTLQGLPAGKLTFTATVMDAAGACPNSRDGHAEVGFEFDGKFAERELVLEPLGGVGPKGITHFVAAPPPGVKAADATLRWILWSGRNAVDCLPRDFKGLAAFNSGLRPPGRYRVEVYGEGFVASKEYDQADGDRDMAIPASAWTPAQPLAGVVRDGGNPAADAVVTLIVKNETARSSTWRRRTPPRTGRSSSARSRKRPSCSSSPT